MKYSEIKAPSSGLDYQKFALDVSYTLSQTSKDLGKLARNTAMASTAVGLTSMALELGSGGLSTPASAAGLVVSGYGLSAAGTLSLMSLSTGFAGELLAGQYGAGAQRAAIYIIGMGVGSSFADSLLGTPVKNVVKDLLNATTH